MPTTTNFGIFYWASLDPASADIWQDANIDALVDIDAQLATRSLDYNFAGYKIVRPSIIRGQEEVYNAGNISGAVTLDYANGHYQYATLTGNVTSLTVSNWPSGKGAWMFLELSQDATGGRTLTLGSAYKTAGGAGITLSTGAADVDTLTLVTRDAGTTIRASLQADWS